MDTHSHAPSSIPPSSLKYRPDIDGLKGIAVLLILFFGSFPNIVNSGFIGVDIFFVISGFLMTLLVLQNIQSNHFNFIDFFSRRIRRIFPSLFVVITCSFIAGLFILSADELKMLGKHMVGGAAFIPNSILSAEGGYFDSDAPKKILLHLWPLGIIVQFYILLPLMLWAAIRQKMNVLYLLLGLAALSFLLNITGNDDHPADTFFSLTTRLWELLAGAILAYMTFYKNDILSKYRKGDGTKQSIIGALLIVASVFFISNDVTYPGWWAVLPVAGTIMLLFSGTDAWVNRYILARRQMTWIGSIAFPLYLWHWPLLAYTNIITVDTPAIWVRALVILVAIGLAWATNRFIEQPVHAEKDTDRDAKRDTRILIGTMAAIFLIGTVTYSLNGFMWRPAAKPFIDMAYDTSDLGFTTCDSSTKIGKLGLEYCTIAQNNDDPVSAVILGDSHAEDKFNGIAKLDKSRNWMLAGQVSCPPVYGVNVTLYDDTCQRKSEQAIDWVADNNDIQTVVLSFYGHYDTNRAYAADHADDMDIFRQSTITKQGDATSSRSALLWDGLNTTVQKLTAAGKKVVILTDIPDLPYFPKDCIRKGSPCEIDREKVDTRQHEHVEMIKELKQSNSDILVFDPSILFCDFNDCYFKHEGTVMYRDSHHLSLKGSDVYATRFLDWLGK